MKRKIVIAVVTAAVLVGGGAGAVALTGGEEGGGGRSTAAGATGDSDAPAAAPAAPAAARVTVGDAVVAGLAAVPGTVTEAELDEEDGGLVWELDVYGSDRSWHDVTVDAGSGKVLDKRVDRDEDRGAPRSASVSLEEAVRAALKSAPGVVTSVEREGAGRWEVDVRPQGGGERELSVDARTGAVGAATED
ncbi:PepSY domain-containing protein [Streptomyces sp. NPDC055992]|uniref:PepSY domain-containing protein n=1 Tax=Streptomyces sp. NPDC055992 TaxID=3345673 RepID=UPI0035DFFD97